MLTIVMSYKQYVYFAVLNPQVSHVLGGWESLQHVRPGPRFAMRIDALLQIAAI